MAASRLAISTFSSRRKTTPVCCSPSRSVTSWNLILLGKLNGLRTSGSQFHGLVKNFLVFQGVISNLRAQGHRPSAVGYRPLDIGHRSSGRQTGATKRTILHRPSPIGHRL